MKIEFDSNKDEANLLKHGVSLEFANIVLSDPNYLELLDSRRDYNEDRYITYAKANNRIWVCIYTIRNNIYRIISLRKANDKEKQKYFTAPR